MTQNNKKSDKKDIRDYPNTYIREFLRKKVDIPVELSVMTEEKEFNRGTGIIKNISPTGAYIANLDLEKDVFPAKPFEILISVKGDQFNGIEGRCKPVRISTENGFSLGVEFAELNVAD